MILQKQDFPFLNDLIKEVHQDWEDFFNQETNKEYFKKLIIEVENEYKTKTIFPAQEKIFNIFKVSPKEIKVLIIGQDPYHGDNQANGISFSVEDGQKLPPSLKNIYKELYSDLGITKNSGDLNSWVLQGVFLLNNTLTVERSKPNSHKHLNWQLFTDNLIEYINKNFEKIIYVLWGNFAKSKKKLISIEKNYVIESQHPSPFSAYNGFFESKPFSKINEILKNDNKKTISFE